MYEALFFNQLVHIMQLAEGDGYSYKIWVLENTFVSPQMKDQLARLLRLHPHLEVYYLNSGRYTFSDMYTAWLLGFNSLFESSMGRMLILDAD